MPQDFQTGQFMLILSIYADRGICRRCTRVPKMSSFFCRSRCRWVTVRQAVRRCWPPPSLQRTCSSVVWVPETGWVRPGTTVVHTKLFTYFWNIIARRANVRYPKQTADTSQIKYICKDCSYYILRPRYTNKFSKCVSETFWEIATRIRSRQLIPFPTGV